MQPSLQWASKSQQVHRIYTGDTTHKTIPSGLEDVAVLLTQTIKYRKTKLGHRRIIYTNWKEKKKEKNRKRSKWNRGKKNVTNEEFKVMITKILTRLEKRVEEINENFIKYMENLKKEAEL